MTKENELGLKSDIDLEDFVRVVTQEGLSKRTILTNLKTLIEEGTATPYIDVVTVGDDKGLIVTEQFSVGSPCSPKESVFGGGDSYPIGTECILPDDDPEMGSAWHCTMSNTTGQTITGAVDVTAELASDSDSSIGLFNGTTSGNYILIGSTHRFYGAKLKVTTAGVMETHEVATEILLADSEDWTEVKYMVSRADWPYDHRADVFASVSGQSEQMHIGFNPLVSRIFAEKTTLNINGTDYTKYWGRIRITSDIDTDPIIEQMKLHTARFEINSDGTIEHYGLSVFPKTIQSGVNKLLNNTVSSPANQDVTYDDGECVADYNDNQFNNGAYDSVLIIQNILDGLHTGVPLVLSVSYYVEGTDTGNVEWEADVYEVSDGFVYDGSETPINYSTIDEITTSSQYVRRTANILIDIDHLSYDDAIVIKLKRDARSANPEDTLPENCVVTNVRLRGYFWRN